MMIDLNNQREKIIKVLLAFNILSIPVGYFLNKGYFFYVVSINIILFGTYFILKNNEGLFYSILDKNSITKQLKNKLENTE
jgi:uncharacterized membrane protein YqaE (UPF0057 family)